VQQFLRHIIAQRLLQLGSMRIARKKIRIVFLGFKYVMPLLMPFLLAYLFSLLLHKPADYLSKRLKIGRRLVAAVLVTLFYLLLAVLALLVGSELFTFARDAMSRFNTVIIPSVEALTEWASRWTRRLDPNVISVLEGMENSLLLSLRSKVAEISTRVVTGIMSGVPSGFLNVLFMVIATYFISLDFGLLRWSVARRIKAETYEKIIAGAAYLNTTLGRLARSYLLIMCITFVEQAIGLTILGVDYSILIAMAIAVFDIFPVVGSGTIMLPWAVSSLVTGDVKRGVGLLVMYVIITIVRQSIEPRIVGDHVGLHPLLTLMCMFVGFRVFGGVGMLGLPILVAVLNGLENDGVITLFPKRELPLPEDAQKRKKRPFLKKLQKKL
ncbi:MAG: sporulation integral membrane protein YtvI, partial [Clostridia bacterium]|nr:sporulation integral membrane protein YtvI [Clostridia bacterium]